MNLPHMHSKFKNVKRRDAASFIDSLCNRKESRFDSMNKPEIKTERLKSRGLVAGDASGNKPLPIHFCNEDQLPKSKQKTKHADGFTYEFIELIS